MMTRIKKASATVHYSAYIGATIGESLGGVVGVLGGGLLGAERMYPQFKDVECLVMTSCGVIAGTLIGGTVWWAAGYVVGGTIGGAIGIPFAVANEIKTDLVACGSKLNEKISAVKQSFFSKPKMPATVATQTDLPHAYNLRRR